MEKKREKKVEPKTKSPAQKEAKASELHPWRLELEIFPSRLPCGHPYRQGASSLETGTGKNFQVGYPVDTPTDKELHPWRLELEIFQVGYPVDTPTDKELHPWRLELEKISSRLPCGHPYRQGASSLETGTGNFSKSVTLWTPLQTRSFILGDWNWKFFQVGYPVDTPTDIF